MSGRFRHEGHEEHEGHEDSRALLEATARDVVDGCFKVHRALGPGLLESAYQACVAREFQLRGLVVRQQVPLPLVYEGLTIGNGYRLDLIVTDNIIVEIKAVETLTKLHEAQLLTYLRLARCRISFLANFNTVLFKQGLRRLVL